METITIQLAHHAIDRLLLRAGVGMPELAASLANGTLRFSGWHQGENDPVPKMRTYFVTLDKFAIPVDEFAPGTFEAITIMDPAHGGERYFREAMQAGAPPMSGQFYLVSHGGTAVKTAETRATIDEPRGLTNARRVIMLMPILIAAAMIAIHVPVAVLALAVPVLLGCSGMAAYVSHRASAARRRVWMSRLGPYAFKQPGVKPRLSGG